MDRIRQALDRAREERVEAVGAPRPVAGPQERSPGHDLRRSGSPAPVAAERVSGGAAEAAARVVDVSPAVLERHRIVSASSAGPAARLFRMLRTQVLQRMRERGWRTLGVVSARSGEGKTTVAVNLALAIAQSPRETALLVDFDLRRPAVASRFGFVPEAGVEDALSGASIVSQCLYRPRPFDGLVLLPARASHANSSEALGGARCQQLIGELRSRYADRIVLFDLPPVLEADDTSIVAPHLDCVLFVAAEFGTAREDVSRSLQLLVRVPVVGTVLNRSTEVVASDAYG
jgi:protein-tyrosine kinase